MTRLTERDLKVAGMVSPLSGTAAKILCIFFLATVGQSFTGQDMADMLGVSANTITPAMRQLTRLGYLQHNGKYYGWSLVSQYRQMSLAELIQENLDNPKIFGSTPPLVVSSLVSDLDRQEDLTNLPSSAPDNPNFFGLSSAEPEAQIEYWLDLGGVTRGTTSWDLLVGIESVDFVKAFVLQFLHERRAWERSNKHDQEPEVGLLVHRLKEGMKGRRRPPVMRCPECLRLERECNCQGYTRQQIPDDLIDIIKR